MIFETFEKGAYISTTEWTKNGQKIVLKVINNNQNRFQMMGDYWIKVIVPRESILILKNNCKNNMIKREFYNKMIHRNDLNSPRIVDNIIVSRVKNPVKYKIGQIKSRSRGILLYHGLDICKNLKKISKSDYETFCSYKKIKNLHIMLLEGEKKNWSFIGDLQYYAGRNIKSFL
jgi:hypothetical protein